MDEILIIRNDYIIIFLITIVLFRSEVFKCMSLNPEEVLLKFFISVDRFANEEVV